MVQGFNNGQNLHLTTGNKRKTTTPVAKSAEIFPTPQMPQRKVAIFLEKREKDFFFLFFRRSKKKSRRRRHLWRGALAVCFERLEREGQARTWYDHPRDDHANSAYDEQNHISGLRPAVGQARVSRGCLFNISSNTWTALNYFLCCPPHAQSFETMASREDLVKEVSLIASSVLC